MVFWKPKKTEELMSVADAEAASPTEESANPEAGLEWVQPMEQGEGVSGSFPPRGDAKAAAEPEPASIEDEAIPVEVTHVSFEPAYDLERAIELLRELPNRNIDLVMSVVAKTLESANIDVVGLVQSAEDRLSAIEGDVARFKQEIAGLEESIRLRKRRIIELEDNQREVRLVKERLSLARGERAGAPGPAGAGSPSGAGGATGSGYGSNPPAASPVLVSKGAAAPGPQAEAGATRQEMGAGGEVSSKRPGSSAGAPVLPPLHPSPFSATPQDAGPTDASAPRGTGGGSRAVSGSRGGWSSTSDEEPEPR